MKPASITKRLFLAIALVALLLPFASSAGAAVGTIYHVTTSGTGANNGLSWSAPVDLQTALARAMAGDEIWVAAGVYKPSAVWPSSSTDSRKATFTMKDGVAIYGGFAGTEDSLSARNPTANVTVLSGDIDNNDMVDSNGVTTTINGSNAYHVVNTDVLNWETYEVAATGVTSSAVLDGFTISGGNANGGSNPDYSGGGMWVHQGSPTLANLRFVGNNAGNGGGGGMYVEPCYNFTPDHDCLQTTPTLTDVVFQNNTTTGDGDGGAMQIQGIESYSDHSLLAPTLTNVTFDGNSARTGGGLWNNDASVTLTGVTFKNNTATNSGGGMYNSVPDPGLTTTLTDVDFIDNSAPSAGGLYHYNWSTPNTSALNGTDVRFLGNHATGGDGGGLTVAVGNATLVNALFSGNTATGRGGGAVVNTYTNATVTNATFSGNSAPTGAGILVWGDPTAVLNLQNSIVYGNTSGTQILGDSAIANISHSLIQGGCPSAGATCTGVISDNPLFADADGADDILGTTDDNPSLSAGSPAIDAGDNTLVPGTVTLDLAGADRFHNDTGTTDTGVIGSQDGVVDMGAYEFQGTTTPPDLTIAKTHTGDFTQGQTGAQYTITATNSGTTAATSGTVTVMDTLPTGLAATSISGTGWNCTLATLTCTRSDALGASSSYPAITLVVSVATDASSSVTNVATVSGGGETDTTNDTASDVTTVNAAATAPSVTTQPTNVTVASGQAAEFTAAASGNPAPSVQWQVRPVGANNWSEIPSATSTTLTLSSVTAEMNGNQYRAVFTNSAGSATSSAATLTVNYAPSVTTQPQSQSVAAGQMATFTAAASGNPTPSVRWQVSTNGGTDWGDISGANATTLSFTAQLSDNGKQYRAVFTNSQGSATTDAATLTVTEALVAPTITTQPESQTVTEGQTATFTAAASGNPVPTVQWQVSTNGRKWSDISGATSTSYSFVAQLSDNGKRYRAVFTNSAGSATSNAATLSVTELPADVGISQTGSYDAATKTITWTLTVTNGGSKTAQGVKVTDTLAKGTKLASANPPAGTSYVAHGSKVIVTIGDLASGASSTVVIESLVTRATGTVENTATVSTTSYDPDPSNNTSTESVTL